MTGHRITSAAARLSLAFLPWMVIACTLGVTWFVWDHERQVTRQVLHSQFEFALRETVSRVEQGALGYEQMLRGVQAMLATTRLQDRKEIHDYVGMLQLDANLSGAQLIGIAELVSGQDKPRHIAAMRRAGFADYTIYPDSQSESYAPVVQREPDIDRKRAPLGLDLWSDPVRRFAMEKARDSGRAAISGKVRLEVDTDAKASHGFIMYLPIYAPGQSHDDVAQRRAHLIGWVYAAFHMSDFMASLHGSPSPGLLLAMYDGADPNESSLLYGSGGGTGQQAPSAQPAMSANEYMVVAGHSWTLSLSTQPEFEERFGRGAQPLIAMGGIGMSVLLAVVTWLIVTGRARALRLAAEMTEELRHMAQRDALTNLPNRALFGDRLNEELERAKRHDQHFAMIFLDLDHFKPINDSYGHVVGDQLLHQVARRLESVVRAVDTVGRIGGDEFVILMTELSGLEPVVSLAEKIRSALGRPFVIEGQELHITCSVGVAVYPQDGRSAIELTKRADDAMYRAKESGRDCVRFGQLGV